MCGRAYLCNLLIKCDFPKTSILYLGSPPFPYCVIECTFPFRFEKNSPPDCFFLATHASYTYFTTTAPLLSRMEMISQVHPCGRNNQRRHIASRSARFLLTWTHTILVKKPSSLPLVFDETTARDPWAGVKIVPRPWPLFFDEMPLSLLRASEKFHLDLVTPEKNHHLCL